MPKYRTESTARGRKCRTESASREPKLPTGSTGGIKCFSRVPLGSKFSGKTGQPEQARTAQDSQDSGKCPTGPKVLCEKCLAGTDVPVPQNPKCFSRVPLGSVLRGILVLGWYYDGLRPQEGWLPLRGASSAVGHGEGVGRGSPRSVLTRRLWSPSVASTPLFLDDSFVAWG